MSLVQTNLLAIDVVAAVNDECVLAANLAISPLLRDGVSFYPMRAFNSASIAYNEGLEMCSTRIVVFAHQDVYLPQPWLQQLHHAIKEIEARDPNWAVIGVFGVSGEGRHVGHCWSSGLNQVLGAPFDCPQQVVSIDELVIILNRSSGLRFDEKLPGFHLYGTDIVQTAISCGFGAYVVHAPVVHNSRPVKSLVGPYTAAYRYMQQKWKDVLPIPTTVVPVTQFAYPLFRTVLRKKVKNWLGLYQAPLYKQIEAGSAIAQRLGFEACNTRKALR